MAAPLFILIKIKGIRKKVKCGITPSVHVEISCINRYANPAELVSRIDIPPQGDAFDDIRAEYDTMLKDQLSRGNSGLIRDKYITFGVEAVSLREAKPKLERIELDVTGYMHALGAETHTLSGYERLKLLYEMMNPETTDPFIFNFDMTARTGLSSKDFIAPTSFDFQEARYFKLGATRIGAVSFLQILAPKLSDRLLTKFLGMENSAAVTIHVQSIDQAKAIKLIKSKITDLDKMKIDEQKKAVRSGYDMEVLPSDLVTYGDEAKQLLEDLQNQNERMFLATILICNTAKSKQKLDNILFEASGIAQEHNCALKRLDFQQEQGFMSSLPIGVNEIDIERGLTTSSTAVFVPFTTQEIFQTGEALYYGINALSGNMIMADRKKLNTPNGLILGTPGAGKSFSAKREITNAFLVTRDDIIICDPEGEYYPLVQALDGQVIRISPNSRDYVNPLDINLDGSDGEDPIRMKADFVLSLCELIIGGRNGLEPVEISAIDMAVMDIYRSYFDHPDSANMPVLEDLYKALLKEERPEAKRVAAALERFVHGSSDLFNHRTNVDINNRLVCFDIKELGSQLKKIGMLTIQDQVWSRVSRNRTEHKFTRYYIDEFHLLLNDAQTSEYSVEIWKRFRKWGGIPTGITQNVSDLLSSRKVGNILANSDFIYMLNQRGEDREILSKLLNISPEQIKYVTNSGAGEGLLFYGNTILPFRDRFPEDTKLYRIMTTRPAETGNEKKSSGG